jgi:hypothetical protein
MATCAYLCPNTGERAKVQLRGGHSKRGHKLARSAAAICPECQHLHFVDPATGEVLSVHHKYVKLTKRDWTR